MMALGWASLLVGDDYGYWLVIAAFQHPVLSVVEQWVGVVVPLLGLNL